MRLQNSSIVGRDGAAPASEDQRRRATLADVAHRAGVSAATVSRVLNDRLGGVAVREETRARIVSAAREMRYTPNALARALSSQRSHMLGVVCYSISDPLVAAFVGAIQDVAAAAQYRLMLCSAGSATTPEAEGISAWVSVLHENRVDGIIILSDLAAASPEDAEHLAHAGVPVALVGRDPYEVATIRGEFDNRAGGEAVAGHLASLGHREVAFLGAPPLGDAAMRRLEGLSDGMTARGGRVLSIPTGSAGTPEEMGRVAAGELLARCPEATAAVARNDGVALGALYALQAAGVPVPTGFSLVGYGDTFYAPYLFPALTTVHVPVDEMGKRVAAALLALIAGSKPPTESLRIAPQLIVRGSTDRVRRA